MDRWFDFNRNLAYDVRILDVLNGDSVIVEIDDPDLPQARGYEFEIRLAGIDAPALFQPHGHDAQRALERLLRRPVGLVVVGADRLHRTLGVFLFEQPRGPMRADDSVNRELVRLGMAYWFRRHADAETIGLQAAELEARDAKRGIWSRPAPEPSWPARAAHAAADALRRRRRPPHRR